MQHIAGKLSTSSFQRYEVCVNRSSDERVMAPGSRGIGAVFVHLSGEDSDQMGDAFGKPRVPRRSWSRYLSNAPGLVDQLVASRKDSAREGGCPGGKTQATGVFLVRLRAVFRSGFRLDLIKSWRSESSTSCMSVSSFQRTRACGSTCCESGRLCAQAWQRRWEDSGNFSTALFRQPVFTRMVDIAPDVGFRQSWYRRKAGATYFPKVQALHRGELGFARYDPANGGRWNVPYAKGFDHNSLVSRPFSTRKVRNRSSHTFSTEWSRGGQFDSVFGLVNGPVKPWSNLVNLGQTWSNLVKALQTLGKCIPNRVSRVSGHGGLPSRAGNGSVKPRSNFGFVGSCGLGPGRPALRAGNLGIRLCVPDRDLDYPIAIDKEDNFQNGRFVPRFVSVSRAGWTRPIRTRITNFVSRPGWTRPIRSRSQISSPDGLGIRRFEGWVDQTDFGPESQISFRDLGGPGRFVPDSSPFRGLGGPDRFGPESQISFRDLDGPGRFVPDSSPFRGLGGPDRFGSRITNFVSRPGGPGRFVPDSSPFRGLGGPDRFGPESRISFRTWVLTQADSSPIHPRFETWVVTQAKPSLI
uniref:Uncharacterized protein n=1 Tax=Fagus sylvatica TaxID=28930 RepID=A0A2N9H255_FAGSY